MERSTGERKFSATDITRNFHLHGRYITCSHSDRAHGSLQQTRATPLLQSLEVFRQTLPQPTGPNGHHLSTSSGPTLTDIDSWEYRN